MIAGIDIGGTKIALGLVDNDGAVAARTAIPIEVENGPTGAGQRMVRVLRELIATNGVDLQGIGIACTGPIDPMTGLMGDVNTLPGWQGWNPVEEMAAAFEVRVALENDADGAALGEAARASAA